LVSTNILLGAIAGITIFLGLPIARLRGVSDRLRGLLSLGAAGVLLFLIVEVGYRAMESVEVAAKAGSKNAATKLGLVFVVGIAAGLIGLAWIEEYRTRRRTAGVDAIDVATMIAIGIGLHNFAEGLAIGQSFSGGAFRLGIVLVIGFALHNATEGFGIAAPLANQSVSWGRLLLLGLIGGGPTVLGAVVGGIWVNPTLELLFLSLAMGSLIYVTRELFRLRFQKLGAVAAMSAVTVGILIGFGTELISQVGQSNGATQPSSIVAATIRFANKRAEPASVSLARGQSLVIENGEGAPLVIEGNGMYVGEVVVPIGGKVSVTATGREGEYRLLDERGQSGIAMVTVQPGKAVEALSDEVNALGALTVLEGHVRASKELHDRGASGQGPDPALDLKRAGKHAGHPQHELLEGHDPDAMVLQRLLHERSVFDPLNSALSAYVKISGDGKVSKDEVDPKYKAALDATEQARRAIGGAAYDQPAFRARVAQFVMETAASEYATATEGDRVMVAEPGVPGKDNFIEYQDARAFLAAAYDLLNRGPAITMTADAQAAADRLRKEVFPTLDPFNPNQPVPASEVSALIERVVRGLRGQ